MPIPPQILPPQIVPPSQNVPPPQGRVLVVDTDRQVVDAIRQAVQVNHPGCEVLEAADGFRAGSLLTNSNPNVLILDLEMPGMDGFDICRLIKSQPQTSHIHVLAAAPRSDYAQQKKDILECGASACLRKPLNMAALMKQMQPLL